MQYNVKIGEVGGWRVPCSPCDYDKLVMETEREIEVLRDKLRRLKSQPLRRGEKELSRRRTVKILTDMYYEQRGNLILFRERAEQRRQNQNETDKKVVVSLPVIPAVGKSHLF